MHVSASEILIYLCMKLGNHLLLMRHLCIYKEMTHENVPYREGKESISIHGDGCFLPSGKHGYSYTF